MNQQPQPLMECRSVSKRYVMGDSALDALKDVDLKLMPGDYLAITGPSGSGKSTLLNLLGLLDLCTAGQVLVGGQDISELNDTQLSRLRNRSIGFIFQNFNLLPRATALENVGLPLVYGGLPHATRRERAREVLERVGLADRMDHRPSQLSGGQRQRVAIARALVTQPKVLLADEPTGNLDRQTGMDVLELFDSLASPERALVVITHEEEVAQRASRRVHLVDGKVASAGGSNPTR